MPLLTCPNCNVGMNQIKRSGVEIDMCPQCRGVWLDRGELEKLLEPLRSEEPPRDAPPPRADYYRDDRYDDRHRGHDDHHRGHDDHYGHGRRRNSILDIFD